MTLLARLSYTNSAPTPPIRVGEKEIIEMDEDLVDFTLSYYSLSPLSLPSYYQTWLPSSSAVGRQLLASSKDS